MSSGTMNVIRPNVFSSAPKQFTDDQLPDTEAPLCPILASQTHRSVAMLFIVLTDIVCLRPIPRAFGGAHEVDTRPHVRSIAVDGLEPESGAHGGRPPQLVDFGSGQWLRSSESFSDYRPPVCCFLAHISRQDRLVPAYVAEAFNIDPSPANQLVMRPLFEVAYGRRPAEELYDRRKDPEQRHDMAGGPRYGRLRTRLRSLLESKLRASEDLRFPTPNYQARTIEGWTVLVSDQLMKKERRELTERALELLQAQLRQIVRVVPTPAATYLHTVPLWFSPPYSGTRPKAEYHPDVGWLRRHGRSAALAKCVEFTNIDIFERETKRMPLFVFHELAHAYHDQVLGFDNPDVQAAYQHAVERHGYDKVKRSFGDGRTTIERAYAMTNAREYFAETSEAFFGRNDFFPFTREELKKHDPEMFRLLERLWLCNSAPTAPRRSTPVE